MAYQTQVKPQQIKTRIEKLISEQRSKGYKPGWVYYQMENLVEKKRPHLIAYFRFDELPDRAKYIAEGSETLDQLMQELEEDYDNFQKEMKQNG